MSNSLNIRDIGAFRVSRSRFALNGRDREGHIDGGDDGMAFFPEKHLAVVTDGIGGYEGYGMDNIDRLERALDEVDNTRSGVREAFFSVCGPEAQSTIASLWFPETFDKRGMVLHAGDSHVMRLREVRGHDRLTVLTKEHNIWDSLMEHSNDAYRRMREVLDPVRSSSDLRMIQNRELLLAMINALETVLRYSPDEAIQYDQVETLPLLSLQRMLFTRICDCRSKFYLCLQDFDWDVREQIGAGQSVHMRSDDRFVLLTDGIYSDVLELDEVLDILVETRDSAIAAARTLVQRSSEKRDRNGILCKNDDRTAMVFDLTDDSVPPWQKVLKQSLGPNFKGFQRRRVTVIQD